MERNTIRLPSGENAGLRSDAFQLFVSRRLCVPSARMMEISGFETRGTRGPTKTMRLPSGDHAGWLPRAM